jgi:hypothetical protein
MSIPHTARQLASALLLTVAGIYPASASEWTPLQFRVEGPSWVYPAKGDYLEVRADLVDAIESRGLVVSYIAHTANMLQRTADAVGAIEQTYDYGDTLLFCSAELTHKLTAANPHHMPLCPYSISAYALAGEPGIVYLAIRAPVKGVPAYDAIHELLEGIIYDTVNW